MPEVTKDFLDKFEKLQTDAVKAIDEMRKISEGNETKTGENAEKLDKLEGVIAKFETVNSELVAKNAANEKEASELKEAVKAMEKTMYRMPGAAGAGTVNPKDNQEYKSFMTALIYGPDGIRDMKADELKYLRTDVDSAGGYLVPDIQVTELDKNLVEISPIRNFARMRTTTGRSLPIAIRTTNLSANMTGEGEAAVDTESVYEVVDVYAKKLTAETAISLEELQDSSFNMEALINADITEEFARLEGAQFVNGSGAANEMTGFMNETGITTVSSGIADDIEFDNFLDLTDIKEGYRLTYTMNRKTTIRAQKLKNGIGDYLWQPSIIVGQPASINGLPYFVSQDMADIAANAEVVMCGDFSRGFTIVDRIGVSMVRDQFTQASKGLIRFIAHKRVGAKTTKTEAFLKLKCEV